MIINCHVIMIMIVAEQGEQEVEEWVRGDGAWHGMCVFLYRRLTSVMFLFCFSPTTGRGGGAGCSREFGACKYKRRGSFFFLLDVFIMVDHHMKNHAVCSS